MDELSRTLATIRKRIQKGAKGNLNEQNTKATLIEPVLRALGWNVEDVDEVVREYRLKSRDKPVDYGLRILRNPRLFVEAKPLGTNLDDRRWAIQIMGYATVAGVEWMVLTDGNEYRIYNCLARLDIDQKLFRKIRVSDDDPSVEPTLELLARDRLEENRIEVLWRAQFVDRQVKSALDQVFSPDSDMLLVNYVAGQTEDLTPEEIRASLARCDVSLDFPVILEPPKKTPPKGGRRTTRKKKAAKHVTPKPVGGSISDLIDAGLLSHRTKLQCSYKGHEFVAGITRRGKVVFDGAEYNSPSTAGGEARATVIGRNKAGKAPPTNGWLFWKVRMPNGEVRSLADLRAELGGTNESRGTGG